MRKRSDILLVAAVLQAVVQAMGAFAGDKVLLENNFDGDPGNDTGAALIGGGEIGGSADPDTGLVVGGAANGWGGFGAETGYDASTVESLTVTWTVSSFTTNAAIKYIYQQGWAFGLRAGSASGADRFRNTAAAYCPKVVFCVKGGGYSTFANWSVTDVGTNGTLTVHSLSGAASAPTLESLLDGFTSTLTVKPDNTWELVTTGLSSDVSTNGTLSTNVTFAELATNVFPLTNLGGESECVMSYVQLRSYTTPRGTVLVVR